MHSQLRSQNIFDYVFMMVNCKGINLWQNCIVENWKLKYSFVSCNVAEEKMRPIGDCRRGITRQKFTAVVCRRRVAPTRRTHDSAAIHPIGLTEHIERHGTWWAVQSIWGITHIVWWNTEPWCRSEIVSSIIATIQRLWPWHLTALGRQQTFSGILILRIMQIHHHYYRLTSVTLTSCNKHKTLGIRACSTGKIVTSQKTLR